MNRVQKEKEHERHKTKRRYRIFAREYLVDLNGKRAAIAAGYSKRSAEVTASRLLRKSRVQKIIRKLMKRRPRSSTLPERRSSRSWRSSPSRT